MSAHENMDKMYRYQRYIYDFSRKYYLLGRDKLLREMRIEPGERVLEIGCGTGRNLAILASKYPRCNFYGLDASAEMLETASRKIKKHKHEKVDMEIALADEFGFESTFDLDSAFDRIFFSYSISMIDSWKESIDNALRNLKPEGSLYFVDFYDQRDLPGWFAVSLQSWLKRFHVAYPKDLAAYLESSADSINGKLFFKPIFKSYSFIAELRKS